MGISPRTRTTPTGLISKQANPNHTSTTYQYDAVGRVLGLVNSGPTEIQSQLAYTYDAAGNRTSQASGRDRTGYAYDALSRLTDVTDLSGAKTAYSYDAAGNRVRQVVSGKGGQDQNAANEGRRRPGAGRPGPP